MKENHRGKKTVLTDDNRQVVNTNQNILVLIKCNTKQTPDFSVESFLMRSSACICARSLFKIRYFSLWLYRRFETESCRNRHNFVTFPIIFIITYYRGRSWVIKHNNLLRLMINFFFLQSDNNLIQKKWRDDLVKI